MGAAQNYSNEDFLHTYSAMFRMLETVADRDGKAKDFKSLNTEEFYKSLCALKDAADGLGFNFILAFDPKDDHIQDISYSSVIHALARDYFLIYYIDVNSNNYVECLGKSLYESFKESGKDFFEDSRESIVRFVHPDDREIMVNAVEKSNLLNSVEGGKTFSIIYRLMMNGEPVYVNLNAVYLEDGDKNHIILGMRNVDENVKREGEFANLKVQDRVYSTIIHTLAKDYFNIFYVNVKTGNYVEYNSQNAYLDKLVEREGGNFFADGYANSEQFIHRDDRERVREALKQQRLIEMEGSFCLTYRWLFNGEPVYVNTKVIKLEDGDHVIVAIRNIDEILKGFK